MVQVLPAALCQWSCLVLPFENQMSRVLYLGIKYLVTIPQDLSPYVELQGSLHI